MAQAIKSVSAMQETQVWSLGQEGPLEKEIATPSSTLVWKIPWTEEPGELQPMDLWRVKYDLEIKQQQQKYYMILETTNGGVPYQRFWWFKESLKMTEWSLFVSKANHSISQLSKSMPQQVTLKKLKLNGFMKTYKTF